MGKTTKNPELKKKWMKISSARAFKTLQTSEKITVRDDNKKYSGHRSHGVTNA